MPELPSRAFSHFHELLNVVDAEQPLDGIGHALGLGANVVSATGANVVSATGANVVSANKKDKLYFREG